jgi:hypothetical protein
MQMPSPHQPESDREQQISRLLEAYEKRLRECYPAGIQTIDEMERTAQEIGEGVKQDIQQEKSDAAGTGYLGKRTVCSCGGIAVYKDDGERRLVTLHGELLLRRSYYWCSHCRCGFHPLDATLGVPKGQVSVTVRGLACRFTSLLPYAKAAYELEQVCGIHLSASTLQRISRQTGEELTQEWEKREEQVWKGSFEPPRYAPGHLHISMDGVMVHVGGVWREVKLGVCYERGEAGPVKDRYCASLEPSHEFGKHLKTLSVVAGEPLCRKVAVVADGSDWIWQESGKHFTRRTQILDFYHACDHLWEIANARFGQGSKQAADWISQQKLRLLEHEQGASQVIGDITDWNPQTEAGQKLRRTTLAYLTDHQKRMSYKEFRDNGHHIGSGVMEASCRWVIQQRMKEPGMRWQREGADAMLALRTAYCSNAEGDLLNAARRAACVA